MPIVSFLVKAEVRDRPYTNPLIKNPTYPILVQHRIVEMPWERVIENDVYERIKSVSALHGA